MTLSISTKQPRCLKASASPAVKVLAVAGLVATLIGSLAIPVWAMGVVVGVQLMAVWEAFRVFTIPVSRTSGGVYDG